MECDYLKGIKLLARDATRQGPLGTPSKLLSNSSQYPSEFLQIFNYYNFGNISTA